MANPERGEFLLKVDGKPFHLTLRLTTNAVCELEDLSGGLKFDEIQQGVKEGRFKHIRLLMWAALREHHAEIATSDGRGLQNVGAFIDKLGKVEDLIPQLQQFLSLNDPPPDEEKAETGKGSAGRPQKARVRPGAISTPMRSRLA